MGAMRARVGRMPIVCSRSVCVLACEAWAWIRMCPANWRGGTLRKQALWQV